MNGNKVGNRVRLISTCRPEAGVKCGDTGTIWHIVASNGVVRVKWDNGARLDLHPEKDKWEAL
ncbi:MAG: DUF4314 domain-containing protein [Dehalococcoidales bacterium]|nr:DUF4314 domain-containing protein [Dehalococcoidales bacterium]